MAKNKLMDGLFGEKAKEKKILKKIKNLKKEYEKLDLKMLSGKISQKELTKYYAITEELIKMSKKFTIKDGKLSINNPQPVQQTPVQPVQQTPVQPVQQTPVQPVQQTPVQPVQQTPVQPVQQTPVQPQVSEQLTPAGHLRLQQIEQEERMAKEAYVRQQQIAQQQKAQQNAMRAEQIKQHIAQQQVQQAKNGETQTPPTYIAIINVAEMPELKIELDASQVAGFKQAIEETMVTGAVFPYMNAVINGSKIVMYRLVVKE